MENTIPFSHTHLKKITFKVVFEDSKLQTLNCENLKRRLEGYSSDWFHLLKQQNNPVLWNTLSFVFQNWMDFKIVQLM